MKICRFAVWLVAASTAIGGSFAESTTVALTQADTAAARQDDYYGYNTATVVRSDNDSCVVYHRIIQQHNSHMFCYF